MRKMTLLNHKQRNWFFLIFLFLISSTSSILFAQVTGITSEEDITTNPKVRDSVVTATVPDIILPSAPILISPNNNSLLNDGTPTFIWQESSDNVGVTYYQMYLDEILLFDNISITSNSNSNYEDRKSVV